MNQLISSLITFTTFFRVHKKINCLNCIHKKNYWNIKNMQMNTNFSSNSLILQMRCCITLHSNVYLNISLWTTRFVIAISWMKLKMWNRRGGCFIKMYNNEFIIIDFFVFICFFSALNVVITSFIRRSRFDSHSKFSIPQKLKSRPSNVELIKLQYKKPK